jgi:hypothetical protein
VLTRAPCYGEEKPSHDLRQSELARRLKCEKEMEFRQYIRDFIRYLRREMRENSVATFLSVIW